MKKSESNRNKQMPMAITPSTGKPTSEEIAALAYSIWEQQGRKEGCDVEHWLKAEAQIRQSPRPTA